MPNQLQTETESEELKRLEDEEELARLEAEEAASKLEKNAVDESKKYIFSADPQVVARSVMEGLETAGKGALAAATLGASEYPVAKLESYLGGYPVEQAIERRKKLQQEYLPAEMVGQIGGSVYGPAAKIATGLSLAGEKGLELIAKTPAVQTLSKSLGIAGEELASIIHGAVTGASQVPLVQTQLGIEQATGFKQPEEIPSWKETALFGAGIGSAIPATKTILKGGKALAEVGMTALLGPTKATRAAYLQQPKEVSDIIEKSRARQAKQLASTVEDEVTTDIGVPRTIVAEEVESAIAPIKSKQAQLESSLKAAQTKELESKQNFESAVLEKKRLFSDELKQSTKSADEAKRIQRDMFKAGVTPEFEADVKLAADKLKEDIIDLSAKSYEILDTTMGRADFSNIGNEIELLKEPLKTGEEILSESEAKAARIADYWADKLESVGGKSGEVPFRLVKRAVQSIDDDLRDKAGLANRSKFSDKERSMLLNIRRLVDQKIKEIPEYAEIMDQVYRKVQLNEDVGNFLGDEKSVNLRAKLSKLWKPGEPGLQTIIDLGKEVNEPFEQTLSDYAALKRMGASPAESAKMIAQLPEQVALQTMKRRQELAQRPELRHLLAPSEHTAWIKTQEDRVAVENALSALKADIENFQGAYNSPYNFVVRAMSGVDPAVRTQLDALRNSTNQDFVRQIKAARTAEALMRSYTQGSRRVQLVKSLFGGLFGYSLGGGAPGVALGSALGAMLDSSGGMVTKSVLDGMLAIKGIPTVQKISTALSNVPDEVRSNLTNGFIRSVLETPKATVPVKPEDAENLSYEVRNSSNLSAIDKAKAMQQIQSNGIVDTEILKNVMLGGISSSGSIQNRYALNAIGAKGR